MNVQLIDIDLEPTDPVVSEVQERRIFGYNRIDVAMCMLGIVMICVLLVFFIWFLIAHSK